MSLYIKAKYGLFLFIFFTYFSFVVKSEVKSVVSKVQKKYTYVYDAAGNRVARIVVDDEAKRDTVGGDWGEIVVTPAVTSDGVTVKTTADLSGASLTYAMSNLVGVRVSEGNITNPVTFLSMPSAGGVYILNIRSASSSKSFKIVKK